MIRRDLLLFRCTMRWRTIAAALISVAGLWAATSQTSLFVDIGAKAGPTDIFYCGGDTTNHFINLRLVGVQSNRSAIGARVTLYAGGRRQVQEVRSGSTLISQSDLRLHFGLGNTDKIARVEIEWPYGKSNDTFPGFKADQFVTITEGRGVTASQQYHAR
jgi:hypothetical protein